MDENLCTKETGYSEYDVNMFAVIPQLVYYQYKMVTNEEQKSAAEKHYRLLNTLEEKEVRETEELSAQQEYEKKLAFLTTAYVEHLEGDYLFHQMFAKDRVGKEFTMVTEMLKMFSLSTRKVLQYCAKNCVSSAYKNTKNKSMK